MFRSMSYVRRAGLGAAAAMLLLGSTAPAALAATTFNPSAAPSGTHVQRGTPSCSVTATGDVVCSSYQLAGVGNTDATATLTATYTATVQCRNNGGQIVESHDQDTTASASTGEISPKNGKLTVPSLTADEPTEAQFEEQATCPNPNWTPEILPGSVELESFTYTLSFEGFEGNYITITG